MILIKYRIAFSILLFVLSAGLFAHEAHHDSRKEVEEATEPSDESEVEVLKAINEDYLKTVKPIFQISCFNCHSSHTKYPWYHFLPGIKKLIDSDISESKKHLDMTNDFPFQGHGSPEKDLEAIGNVVNKGTMPPFRYRMMHWGSGLSKEEREIIMKWIKGSQQKLNTNE